MRWRGCYSYVTVVMAMANQVGLEASLEASQDVEFDKLLLHYLCLRHCSRCSATRTLREDRLY